NIRQESLRLVGSNQISHGPDVVAIEQSQLQSFDGQLESNLISSRNPAATHDRLHDQLVDAGLNVLQLFDVSLGGTPGLISGIAGGCFFLVSVVVRVDVLMSRLL